jgi:uncharacterized repeat protein (TIGR03803 family)
MTMYGGKGKSSQYLGSGVIFSLDLFTNTYTREIDFSLFGGSTNSKLKVLSTGELLGITKNGGTEGAGSVFEFSLQNMTISEKHSISAISEGDYLLDELTEGNNLNLYGSTYLGGTNNIGTIYSYDKLNNTLNKLHDFNSSEGNQGVSNLIFVDSILYGLTGRGASNNYGDFYSFDLRNNSLNQIFVFDNSQYAASSLILLGDSIILGLTSNGKLFKYNIANAQFQFLTTFNFGPMFSYGADLIYNKYDGMLYVSANRTGFTNNGQLFRYDFASNSSTTIYDFNTASNATKPFGRMLIASNHNLYGFGKDNNDKYIIYEYNFAQNLLSVKHQFNSNEQIETIDIGLIEICHPSYGNLTIENCGNYFGPDNNTYNYSGVYNLYLNNSQGCDSIVTLNLTIKNPTSSIINESVCNSFTAPDNQVYTQSGTYTAIIPNSQGCDSTITINLTVSQPTSTTISETACSSYTALDNQVYTTSGTYTVIIPNAQGCDSMITIDLTIKTPTSSTITESVCSSYTAPDNQVYSQSGTYTAIIPNSQGCDSTITINLTITNLETTITQLDSVLSSTTDNASSYQWIDCLNGIQNIPNETSQSFVPSENGEYAVVVLQNNCSDTSECILYSNVGLQTDFKSRVSLYPNPSLKQIVIDFGETISYSELKIYSLTGNLMENLIVSNKNQLEIDVEHYAKGMYFIDFKLNSKTGTLKFVKE